MESTTIWICFKIHSGHVTVTLVKKINSLASNDLLKLGTVVTSELERLRQEDLKFKPRL